jgi:hypothetical protein
LGAPRPSVAVSWTAGMRRDEVAWLELICSPISLFFKTRWSANLLINDPCWC